MRRKGKKTVGKRRQMINYPNKIGESNLSHTLAFELNFETGRGRYGKSQPAS